MTTVILEQPVSYLRIMINTPDRGIREFYRHTDGTWEEVWGGDTPLSMTAEEVAEIEPLWRYAKRVQGTYPC